MNPDRGYRKANLPENAKRVFEGKIFDVYQWQQELYDGSTDIFEKIVRPDTVVVFPVLSDSRILIVEDSQPGRETKLTAPSGRIEEGETPELAARRELLEETGHDVAWLEPFYEIAMHPQKMDWKIYAFIGRGARKIQEPALDPGEKITLRPLTFDELMDSVREGGNWFKNDFGPEVYEAFLDPQKREALRRKFAA